MEKNAHPFMPTRAEGRDPNLCGLPDCNKVWNSIDHQPSRYLEALGPYRAAVAETVEKLSEGAGVPPALLHHERASGPPRDPSADAMAATWENTAAPATHTGRPSMHSGSGRLVPAKRTIMCPMGAVSPNEKQCQFVGSDYRPDLFHHLKLDHKYSEEAVLEYMADPWYADEPRSSWKDRTFYRRYGTTEEGMRFLMFGKPGRGKTSMDPRQTLTADLLRDVQEGLSEQYGKLITEVQDSYVWEVPAEGDAKLAKDALAQLVHVPLGAPKCPKDGCELTHPHLHSKAEMMSEEHCDHPNGFGPNGCPCGASQPDEDAPDTFRHIDTGKDEPGVRCPVTLDCMHGVWPASKIREHVVGEHGWSQERFDGWAESVALPEFPLVPEPLAEDMAERQQRQAEVDAFLDPSITVEDMMAIADRGPGAVLTDWWLKRAEEEADAVIPKAIEYGSNSLMQLGRKMAQLQGREVDDAEALELGCWANLVQKVERITDSVMRGERCSDDTIYDVGIYVKMIQRIRDAGSWPGV